MLVSFWFPFTTAKNEAPSKNGEKGRKGRIWAPFLIQGMTKRTKMWGSFSPPKESAMDSMWE